jgi:tape measure domain-containing protein
MADDASLLVRLIDRVTAPARAMSRALSTVTASEKAVTKASKEAQVAVTAAGNAVALAGAKAATGARQFERAAQSMKVAARNASWAAAQKNMGFISRSATNGNAYAFAGGRRLGRTAAIRPQFGPVYDPSAQGAAAGGMGPILNRRAQRLGIMDRLNVASKGARDWNSAAGGKIANMRESLDTFAGTPGGMAVSGAAAIASAAASIGVAAAVAATKVVALGNAIGAFAAYKLTEIVIEMRAFSEASKQAFERLTGSKEAGAEFYREALRNSRDLGTNVVTTVDAFKSLRAQQFTLGESTTLYRMTQDLATVTGHADAAERALYGITKIKSTGKLQGDELMILAEAGVSLDLVYSKLEKRLGKTREQVLKLQQAGKITANDAITSIMEAIGEKTHSKNAGDAAQEYSRKTLMGRWGRLKNAPGRMALSISDLIDITPLNAIMGKIEMAFASIDPGQAATFVDKMIAGLGVATDMAVGFAQGFGSSFHLITEALGMGTMGLGDMAEAARGVGVWVADFFVQSIRYTKGFISVLHDMFSAKEAAFNWESILKFVTVVGLAVAKAVELFTWLIEKIFAVYDAVIKVTDALGLTDAASATGYGAPPPIPDAPTARANPRFGTGAGGTSVQNHIPINIKVEGDASPEAQAAMKKSVQEGVGAALRMLARGPLAQASG